MALPSSTTSFLRRALFLAVGLYIMAFGTALSVQALLGTSPISSIPLVLHLWRSEWSVGTVTVVMNTVFLVLTAILRKRPSPRQLIQLGLIFLYGPAIDLNVHFLGAVAGLSYPVRLLLTVPGAVLAGFGVWAQIRSRFPMLPGDGLVKTISEVFRLDFPKTKIVFDCVLVAAAALFSVVAMGGIHGIREGTLVAAVLVGLSVKGYDRLWP